MCRLMECRGTTCVTGGFNGEEIEQYSRLYDAYLHFPANFVIKFAELSRRNYIVQQN